MASLTKQKTEDMDVFMALYRHWKSVKNPLVSSAIKKILFLAKVKEEEINLIRKERERHRLLLEQKGNINGNLLTGELHDLEYQACRELCPALKAGNGIAAKEGWRWVIKQPWGKEFRAAPFEKRHTVNGDVL